MATEKGMGRNALKTGDKGSSSCILVFPDARTKEFKYTLCHVVYYLTVIPVFWHIVQQSHPDVLVVVKIFL